MGEGTLCGSCIAQEPEYDKARAALVYADESRDMILSLKHGDRTIIAGLLARFMMQAGHELLQTVDIVAPVPLHWTRLFKRKYNQAALLAQELSQLTQKRFQPDLLIRTKRPA
jgi:predicted amidophosphoribosyltransferase